MKGRVLRSGDNKGLTLVELLVTMAITGIVMTLVVAMFTSMSTGYTTQTGRADLQQSVRAVTDLDGSRDPYGWLYFA